MSMWVACGAEQLSWWDTEFFSKCEELLLLRSDKRRCLQEQLVFADAPASIEEVAHLDASFAIVRPSFQGSIGFYLARSIIRSNSCGLRCQRHGNRAGDNQSGAGDDARCNFFDVAQK